MFEREIRRLYKLASQLENLVFLCSLNCFSVVACYYTLLSDKLCEEGWIEDISQLFLLVISKVDR